MTRAWIPVVVGVAAATATAGMVYALVHPAGAVGAANLPVPLSVVQHPTGPPSAAPGKPTSTPTAQPTGQPTASPTGGPTGGPTSGSTSAAASTPTGGSTPTQASAAGTNGAPNQDFPLIAGPAGDLYPGAVVRVPVSVSNPYPFDVLFTAVTATVSSTSAATCPATATNIVVQPYQGPPTLPLAVPRGQRRTAGYIPVSMPGTVAQACQGVTFTLHLQGTATKAKP